MCGLFGFSSTEKHKNVKDRKDMLVEGLWTSALRGTHSTGIAAVKVGEEKESPSVFKKALSAPDFIQLSGFERIHGKMEDYSMILGHTRHATYNTINDKCAHPHQYDHITLTHNGHITNAHTILPAGKTCAIPVDSAAFCMAMALLGEQEALERADGAFALVWHNAKDGTLNFARNDSRPLKWCNIYNENTIYWGSERLMLVSLLERNNIYVDKEFFDLGPGVWVKFDVTNLKQFKTQAFTKRPLGVVGGAGRTNHQSQIPTATQNKNTTTESTSSSATAPATAASGANTTLITESLGRLISYILEKIIKEVPESEIVKRETYFRQCSGRPVKGKNVRHLKETLKRVGMTYDQSVMATAAQFTPYQNQGNNLGEAKVWIKGVNHIGRLQHIKHEEWTKLVKMETVLCRVIGWAPAQKGARSDAWELVLERHPLMEEFNTYRLDMAQRRKAEAEARRSLPAVGWAQEGSTDSSTDSGHGVELLYSGPGGKAISLGRFLELGRTGCSICSGVVSTINHEKVIWINDSPICAECAENPAALASANIELPKLLTSPTRH